MINILGVNIDKDLSLEDFLNEVSSFLISENQKYIVTPNPEIILEAQKDEELLKILNKADLSLADGFGLKLASLSLKRLSGSDVLSPLLSLAEEKGKKVLIINREDGLSSKEEISSFLENSFPNLVFLIKDLDHKTSIIEDDNDLLNFEADIMICNFGAPYQEKFVFNNLSKLETVKVGISLGGSFDFLTGKIKRAPKIFRSLGLEWLWRLFKQPRKRIKRIFNAIFVFSFKFFSWRIKKN